ncbi:DNA ligase [Luteimonas sp. R10]|uniref:DNA ligase n=1 Tax=Luteimonas sp. R10 TaxID=3108176 RepID=UPI00308813A6|nr:DNA ligase [Luteimonas sp. R10]
MALRWCLVALLSCLLAVPSAPTGATPPRLMLASKYEAGIEVSDYWVSEKLDGVRGRWDGRALWTRGGHRVEAPDWFVAGWPREPLDGELWIGRGRFEEVSGIVRARAAGDAAWRRVRFMVFDLPGHGGPFEQRLLRMRTLLGERDIAWLQPVVQVRFADASALQAHLQAVVAGGGEGLMLHHRDACYRAGRSDALLKLKPFEDAEARVVGHTVGKGKYAGMLGALVVEREDGLRFRLGSGLSDAQRATPPPVGSYVTYRYNGLTANGVPRFARFLRQRHEMPPPDPE